ncbi:MAG TPA: NAD(P)-dependent oxidoreductase [Chloroflexota bacterium]|nr:NAD(P)-dependent oxidoreductase [Chloroflexota bacterium]
MRLLITGGESPLARALAVALSPRHEIRLAQLAGGGGPVGLERVTGDLRQPSFVAQALQGVEATLHLAPLWPGLPAGSSDQERLDLAARGTYVLYTEAARLGVRRVVQASTLDLFERCPASWRVNESWRLRHSTGPRQLAAYLAEASARECSRVEPVQTVCLRLGHIVEGPSDSEGREAPRDAAGPALAIGEGPAEGPAEGPHLDPATWLHLEDAVQAFERALDFVPSTRYGSLSGPPAHGWWVFHIPGAGPHTRVPLAEAGQEAFGYRPVHAFSAPPAGRRGEREGASPGAYASVSSLTPAPAKGPARPIRKVVVFGAGGPLAGATIPLLTESYSLRITDLRPMAEIVAAGPRGTGAPTPRLLDPPHEMRQVDVTDPAQVLAACEGMDAIVNCTVVRPHLAQAFLVNCIGAYNVMRAAVAHGIRRVVHTGPQQVMLDRPGGYWWDADVTADAPPRPGAHLYRHSKYLGQEVCRLFAEEHGLEVPVLLFSTFVDPPTAAATMAGRPGGGGLSPLSVSWDDAGHAMRRALEVPSLPSPFEVFLILADLPHGRYSNQKARRLLGWQPRDTLEALWTRPVPAET